MQKILVANRGEIALRVMKTIHKMGIKSVAVFSDADRNSPHVHYANEAVCLGPAPSGASYLNAEKIIAFAKQLCVDGIHPGYGFLSENADFARKVEQAGMIFIGPSPESIELMGSKLAAKDCVKEYGIPMVPGYDQAIHDIKLASAIAEKVGYPVLIKASAGGGGKGMKLVNKESELKEQMERAISEATSSFGDGSVFIEKYILSPRHIEIQVLADNFGNTVHLFERECSIQRRHQKVVEESPSSILTPDIRMKMGEAAVMVAKSCNYRGAGTVEFLVDASLNFYFLEMNTRLQVEHPVSEMITGKDLVEEQIRIARGEPLSFKQADLVINGHSLELRIYAEDPLNNFLPSVGKLEKYQRPSGRSIRVDDGYEQGMTIPIYYDPLIAKLITHGKDRQDAIRIMKLAIARYKIEGVSTTLAFGSFVFNHEAFVSGNFDTSFISKYYTPTEVQAGQQVSAELASAVALKIWLDLQEVLTVPDSLESAWKTRRS